MKYLIDFETKSDLSIKQVGVKKYVDTPNSDIVCMSWKPWDDLGAGPTRLWIPGNGVPFPVQSIDRMYAHNIQFDYEVWHTLGMKYYFPEFSLEQCVDVMALCGRYTYPQGLDFVGRVLKLKVQKDRKGKALMNKICLPPFEYTPQQLSQFYQYCIRDTDTMWEVIQALPRDELDPKEQKIWVVTAKINRTGLPIDTKAVARIYEVTEYYKKKKMKLVSDLTDGEIQTVNQTKAIVMWAAGKGVKLPNLQAATVQEHIEYDINPDVTALLKLRQELGKTSTAKYKKLMEQDHYGRVYDNLRYYGAAPGRWSGMGFQMHNLPRDKVNDPEATIAQFYDTSILKGHPIQAAKALLRPMIKAPKGFMIAAADYSAIENVLLLWVAGETKQLNLIRAGFEHYKTFAASVYNIPYEVVNEIQRFLGKVGILGAGYNAGAGAFLNFAIGYGLDISYEQADSVIQLYRKDHPAVKKLWYQLRDHAIAAIEHKGLEFTYRNCAFKVVIDRNGGSWLRLRLPSGRSLVYNSPELRDDKWGQVPTHMGINSYTKQWSRLKLIPGRITENICQALARDILAHAKLDLMDEGYKLIGSVHDEVLCEVKEHPMVKALGVKRSTPDDIIRIMTNLPDWCRTLPLKATGFIERRYKKG